MLNICFAQGFALHVPVRLLPRRQVRSMSLSFMRNEELSQKNKKLVNFIEEQLSKGEGGKLAVTAMFDMEDFAAGLKMDQEIYKVKMTMELEKTKDIAELEKGWAKELADVQTKKALAEKDLESAAKESKTMLQNAEALHQRDLSTLSQR